MVIISHRGYWLNPAEKNTQIAFERSFSHGFGAETDVRDRESRLVISHDLPDKNAMPLEQFFNIYTKYKTPLPLALNIKSDGLQFELKKLLIEYNINNYFVFDMAVPDGLLYSWRGMNTYTRHSEYEPAPPYYEKAHGVWLDEFNGHWLSDEVIEQHLSTGKAVCIVSPELHKRSYEKEWQHYCDLEKKLGKDRLMLCTDLPVHAKEFFNA
jgi:glycerophosphoryl diester phosphodiesterase